ncbi:hypothetical protein Poly24_25810 [Rosistilla carotiformis]|uniref:Double zinc ribbon n=1 Tax=Rosistilla carotiformis TaxID=2528017 RepID=A0A518JTL2_9BACT|nr:hypothetical protein [Rosistilla carotiformis]QDV68868.1 hypothetical protein Poly24_25810 [Rosistilla carotiformis]
MAISVKCKCGKTLNLKDEFAGKSIRCPGCKEVLKVPGGGAASAQPPRAATPPPAAANPTAFPAAATTPAPAGGVGSLFDDEGIAQLTGPVCMACAKEMRPGTVVCMNCGFNTQTGQRVQGFTESQEAASEFGHAALDEAAAHMRRDAKVQQQISGTGMPVWVLATILMCLGGLAVMGVFVSNAIAAEEGADGSSPVPRGMLLVILLFLQICSMFFWIKIMIHGFKESPMHGFLSLFIGLYAMIYAFMRPEIRTYGWSLLTVSIIWSIVYFGGFALLGVLGLG